MQSTEVLSVIILEYLEVPERYILWRRFGNPIFAAECANEIAAAFVVRTGWLSAVQYVDLNAAVIVAFYAKDFDLVRLYIANGASKQISRLRLAAFRACGPHAGLLAQPI